MTTLEKFVQLVIPRFDGHYDFWSMTIDREILETILDKSTSHLEIYATEVSGFNEG